MNHLHLQLRELVEYLRWSDGRALAAARSLDDAQYRRELHISLGSVHALLVHCMAVEWLWLCRLRGESPECLEQPRDYPTRMAVEQRWPLVHSALVDYVGGLTPAALAGSITYHNKPGETVTLHIRDAITHLVDHGTYHRGQLMSMIKLAGGQPGAISYRNFALERARVKGSR